MDKHQRHEIAGLFGQLHGLHAHAAASLLPVFLRIGPLAVAQRRDGQYRGIRLHRRDVDDLVAFRDPHGAYADGIPADRAHMLLVEADALALPGGYQHLVFAGAQPYADQFVAFTQRNGNQAVLPQVAEVAQGGLLDHAVAGGHHQVVFVLRLPRHRQHGGYLLAARDLQQVDDRRAARLPPGFRNLVALQAVHPAQIREEHDLLVRAGHKHLRGVVRLLHVHAGYAAAAAVLRPVDGGGNTLHIPFMGHGDHHVFFLDQVFDIDIVFGHGQLTAPFVAVFVADLADLGLDYVHQQMLIRQDRRQPFDGLLQLLVFLLQPFPFQSGQAGQPHVQDRLGLLLAELKAGNQSFLRGGGILAGPDDGHDLVDVVQGLQQAFQDMGPFLGLVQLEPGPPGHHVLLVLQVIVDDIPQVQHPGLSVHQRQHVGAEVLLHGRMLVEHVQHDLRLDIPLQLDHDPHALPVVGFVPDIADSLDLLLMHQVGDLLDQDRFVDLVGDLRHDDAAAAAAHLFHVRPGPHGDPAVTGQVGLPDAAVADNQAGGREIRPLDMLHQVLDGAFRVVNHADDAVDDFRQVVGRNIGRHADGDAAGAVDQEVREAGRQHGGLLQRFVEVGIEIHRVLVNAVQQVHGQLLQAGFRITHGRRAVAVHGAEVSLSLNQRIADVERLGQAHHGVVHGGVPVRVEFTQNVADDAGAFAGRFVRRHTQFLGHVVQDPPVYRLQSVAHVRQRPVHNHRHGIGDETLFHFLFQVYRNQFILNHCLTPSVLSF